MAFILENSTRLTINIGIMENYILAISVLAIEGENNPIGKGIKKQALRLVYPRGKTEALNLTKFVY